MHIFWNMMTSSNGNIFRVTDPLCGDVTGEFPSQRPLTWTFDVFFYLCLNKRLSKHPIRRWFDTSWRSSWRHSNDSMYLESCMATVIDTFWPVVKRFADGFSVVTASFIKAVGESIKEWLFILSMACGILCHVYEVSNLVIFNRVLWSAYKRHHMFDYNVAPCPMKWGKVTHRYTPAA